MRPEIHSPHRAARSPTASHLGRLLCLLLVLASAGARAASPPSLPELRLQSMEIRPLRPGVEAAVQRLLPLLPGTPLSPERLLEARRVLERSGYFTRVDLYTVRGDEPGQVRLVIDAELDRSAHFETGFGHEPFSGWYLNLAGVRWNSPFRSGGSARLGLQLGQWRSGSYAQLELPHLGRSPLDLLVDLGSPEEQWNVFVGDDHYQQRIERGVVALGLRRRVRGGLSGTLWLGRSTATPTGDIELRSGNGLGPLPVLEGQGVQQRYTDLRLDLLLDRRDRLAPWRRGGSVALRLRASDIDEADAFYRFDADLRWRIALPGHGALALRGSGRKSDPKTPYHLRPVFGGLGSVRGFRDASLSGPFGARALWTASAELRLPLWRRADENPRLTGILFADTGQSWDHLGRPRPTAVGVGYGLRIRVPWIQVFGLDVGIPLTTAETEDPFWFHARLGFGF